MKPVAIALLKRSPGRLDCVRAERGSVEARYGDLVGRLTVLALAVATMSLAVAMPAPAAAGAPHTILHYGDSLTVGTGLYLSSFLPGWSIVESASISRHADEGPGAMGC